MLKPYELAYRAWQEAGYEDMYDGLVKQHRIVRELYRTHHDRLLDKVNRPTKIEEETIQKDLVNLRKLSRSIGESQFKLTDKLNHLRKLFLDVNNYSKE